MAHFAELDNDNVVLRVIVVNNDDVLDSDGNESEQVGVKFCEQLFGGRWVQTSYNANFRRRFAGIGQKYDEINDVFIESQPAPWFVLNDNFDWECPLGIKPETGEPVVGDEWLWLDKVFGTDSPLGVRGVLLG